MIDPTALGPARTLLVGSASQYLEEIIVRCDGSGVAMSLFPALNVLGILFGVRLESLLAFVNEGRVQTWQTFLNCVVLESFANRISSASILLRLLERPVPCCLSWILVSLLKRDRWFSCNYQYLDYFTSQRRRRCPQRWSRSWFLP